ncbi:MAG: hypothetical protein U1E26_10225 [Coriobacteriia bacterium]|nr:hypothetical protein [Coriobacteriia bacterium]
MNGAQLLQRVSERVLVRWLTSQGRLDVHLTGGLESLGGRAVDLTYAWQGGQQRIKVKADPYFGTDARKIADRGLTFYRGDASAFAFEAVANAATREPGWMFETTANEIYYHYLAINQPEEEVAALLNEPDEVFFAELAVERDELVILPVKETRRWFETNYEQYTPRPVMSTGVSAWYRLVPRVEIERAVPGIRNVGPVFARLMR